VEALPTQLEPLVERRQHPRLPYAEPTQYRDVFKPHELFAGSLPKDLSAGGLRLTTPRFIAKDSRLVVLFCLPDSLRQIRTICRVVWERAHPFGGGYEYGLQFIEMTADDKEAIAGFVERGVQPPAQTPSSHPLEDLLKSLVA